MLKCGTAEKSLVDKITFIYCDMPDVVLRGLPISTLLILRLVLLLPYLYSRWGN